MSLAKVGYGDFFERRGREGFAEGAKEVKEKNTKFQKYKIEKIENNHFFYVGLKTSEKSLLFGFPFLLSFLRPVQNLRALCVQKLPVSLAMATSQVHGARK